MEESLRKKSNKSRISRLRRIGPVSLEVVRSRREVEPFFETIVDFCDIRQGAAHGVTPFRDDPLKREFYLRLIDCPELTHTTLLRAGDEVVAAHIGARNGTSVQLGLSAYSPFRADASPGKLLMLLLGRQMAEEGYRQLDLTPGGDEYKDRFADRFDEVHAVEVFFDQENARASDRNVRLRGKAKAGLTRVGLSADSLRRYKARVSDATAIARSEGSAKVLVKSARYVIGQIASDVQLNYYRMDPNEAARMSADERFHCDTVRDLLLYKPADPHARPQPAFFRDALARWDSGAHVYTVAGGGVLAHYAWLGPYEGRRGTEIGDSIELPAGSIMLWDDYTHPTTRGKGLHQASIRHRLHEAAAAPGVTGIFISALALNAPSRHNIEKVGFRLYATLTRRTRFRRKTWEWHFQS